MNWNKIIGYIHEVNNRYEKEYIYLSVVFHLFICLFKTCFKLYLQTFFSYIIMK